jgi:hypothetical protein
LKPSASFLDAFLPYCKVAVNNEDRLQFVYKFDNGLGASVIWLKTPYGTGSYGFEKGLWELALVDWTVVGGVEDFEVSYNYYLDDVAGDLTEAKVLKHLRRIAKLIRKGK